MIDSSKSELVLIEGDNFDQGAVSGTLTTAFRTINPGQDDPGLYRLHGKSAEERTEPSSRMIWLHYAIALVAILITGRLHGRRLDEQDEPDAQR
jgi:hypothetical protein